MLKKLSVFLLVCMCTLLVGFATIDNEMEPQGILIENPDYTPLPLAPATNWPPQLPRNADGTPALPDHIEKSFVKVRVDNSQGSGFIFKPGYVMTNAHVVMDNNGNMRSGNITVSLRNRSVTARFVGYSPRYDMAVLSVPSWLGEPAPIAALPPIIGDPMVAVGHPSSNAWIARGPLLSTTTRVAHRFNPNHPVTRVNMLVYDAPVLHGYSGGPTMNANTGEVVGLTVGLVTRWHNAETNRMVQEDHQIALAYPIGLVMIEAERLIAAANNS